jgi:nucleotide-binding universal stress UspA family protein
MRTILIATDGSPAGTAALDEALELARATGDGLLVVTVWRALQGDYGVAYPSAALLTDLLESERCHAEAVLLEAAELAAAAGVTVQTELVTGDPAERICALAREHDVRLVAVGTRGHSVVRSLLLGSVSSAVVRRAPCPVLVVSDRERRLEPQRTGLAAALRART